MATQFEQYPEKWLAKTGLILTLPPLYFVLAAVLKYGFGVGFLFDPLDRFLSDPWRLRVFNIISPVVFLGGLLFALILNLFAVFCVAVRRSGVAATVDGAQLKAKLWNIAVVTISALLLATLITYAFLENFTHR